MRQKLGRLDTSNGVFHPLAAVTFGPFAKRSHEVVGLQNLKRLKMTTESRFHR